MAFYNDCCRATFQAAAQYKDPETGEELTCGICVQHFIYDGSRWRNDLEIGTRKIEKYRRIKMANDHIHNTPHLKAALV